jgi:nitroreductase
MNTIESIHQRRSIRKFKTDIVPRELIEKLLEAATQAPSAMNRQPWRFVVLEGAKKDELIEIFQKGIAKFKKFRINVGAAAISAEHMKQAPVLLLVFNAESKTKGLFKFFSSVMDVLFIQSIGAAIQTLLLAAHQSGLGTLWIGHIFYACKEICKYVKKNEELIAAVCIGYADETPQARPRKSWTEVTEWF